MEYVSGISRIVLMLLSPLTLPEMGVQLSSRCQSECHRQSKHSANNRRGVWPANNSNAGTDVDAGLLPLPLSSPSPSPSQCDDVSCSSCSSCSLVQRVLKSASGPEQDWAPPYTHFHFHFHFTNTSPTLELGKASIFPHLMKTKPIDRASLASLA